MQRLSVIVWLERLGTPKTPVRVIHKWSEREKSGRDCGLLRRNVTNHIVPPLRDRPHQWLAFWAEMHVHLSDGYPLTVDRDALGSKSQKTFEPCNYFFLVLTLESTHIIHLGQLWVISFFPFLFPHTSLTEKEWPREAGATWVQSILF